MQQELLDFGRLAGQHLLGQVAQDEAVRAAERGHEARRGQRGPAWTAALARKGCQLQPGGPALGALGQAGQVRLRQGQPHAVAQERGDFGPGEAQVGASHLGQLVAGAQAGQRQCGVLARHQRQMEARRRVRQQALQHRQDGRVLDGVEVVKDTDEGHAKPFGSSKTRRVYRRARRRGR